MAKDKKKKKKESVDFFERYKILVNARNFHYENFNKWLTYFYVANAAIFVGYIQLLNANRGNLVCISILAFGFIAGVLLYWSSKGYYYWNINFIMLVNYYESKLLKWEKKERIYSMFGNKSVQNDYFNPLTGANYSTSKIAIIFAFIIAFSWGSIFTYSVLSLPSPFNIVFPKWAIVIASLVISFSIITLLGQIKKKNKQHILWSNTDPLHDLEINQEEKE